MENLGEKIYTLRKENGISQEELAFELNTTRQTVSRWERNEAKPTDKNIKSLCKFFGVEESCFVTAEAATFTVPTEEIKPYTKKPIIVTAVIVISVLLVFCVAACCVASYISFMPSYYNGLNNAAVERFRYIGIVCLGFGVLALAGLACICTVVVISIKRNRKK